MSKCFASVDVGGTKVLAAVLDRKGRILARHKAATQTASTDVLLDQIEDAIARAARKAGVKMARIEGVALGVPGVVKDGVVTLAPNVPLQDVDIKKTWEKRLKMRAVVANDGSLGTLGESARGAGRGSDSCCGFWIGTGIGGGVVINGKLWEGARGLGGEVGHFLMPDGAQQLGTVSLERWKGLSDLCSREALDKYLRASLAESATDSAFARAVADLGGAPIKSGLIRTALQEGDPLVSEAVRRQSHVLGVASASVSNIVDPACIVFGGGLIEACGRWMMPQIRESARRAALKGAWDETKIVESQLGDDAILIGGWALLQRA